MAEWKGKMMFRIITMQIMLTRCNESEGKSWTSVIIVNINSSVKRFDGFLIPFSQHKFISDITFMKKDKIYSKDYHMK
jgi:hypothetical protein